MPPKPDPMRVLESLTPGGSEYHDDPERCAEFIRSSREQQHRIIVKLIKQRNLLLQAAEQVAWKLSHNFSPSGRGDDCRPGTVDRTDATVRMLRDALDNVKGETP